MNKHSQETTKQKPKRTLNLDLSDMPPSSDKKVLKDFVMDDMWFKNFYTPKDETTKLYLKAIDEYEVIFYVAEESEELYGFTY